MTFLNNSQNQEEITIENSIITTYKLKENDNLYIDIQSLNPEVSALFNPSKGAGFTGGTSQNYGDISGQFLNGFQIDMMGNVTLPIIGKINVINRTVAEAQNEIQRKADEYLNNATVKVKLLSFKVTVLGEVKNPGVYYNYHNHFTIIDAISMASGESDYSKISKFRVIRSTEKGNKIFQLDLNKKEFMTSEAYYLLPNDVVYVEPHAAKSLKLNLPIFTLVLSSVSTLILLLNFIEK